MLSEVKSGKTCACSFYERRSRIMVIYNFNLAKAELVRSSNDRVGGGFCQSG
jgi:hypothetical protein